MLTQGSTSPTLTDREREVADLLADGLSRKAIARQLDVSVNTVDAHLKNINGKLPDNGARRSIQIVRFILTACSTAA